MTVYGLTRVSTDEQEDGTSLATQARQIRGQCMTANLPDPVILIDVVSGNVPLEERENAGPVLRALQRGDIIIASKMDRIFRSARDALNRAEEWKVLGVDLYLIDIGPTPVTGNGTSKLFFTMLAGIAEFERDRIKERTIDGRKSKRAKQGHIGGQPPFGYQVVGEGKAAMLVEDAEQQLMMGQIRAMRGTPVRTIKERLGAAAPSIGTIARILKGADK